MGQGLIFSQMPRQESTVVFFTAFDAMVLAHSFQRCFVVKGLPVNELQRRSINRFRVEVTKLVGVLKSFLDVIKPSAGLRRRR